MVSRIVAWSIDPEMRFVDKASFRTAQMMYMPTASRDAEYISQAHDGELLDWEALVEKYAREIGDPYDLANLPKCKGENLRKIADKAENPLEKAGLVGWFCRAYPVPETIDEFELPYVPADGEDNRYTYAHGTTSNGVVVYDDGLFLYSHHSSDPAGGDLRNAFDLVRIHKFGDRDTGDYEKMSDRPSWKAMMSLCEGDARVQQERTTSQSFGGDYDDPDSTDPTRDTAASGLIDPVTARLNSQYAIVRNGGKTLSVEFLPGGGLTFGSVEDLHKWCENDRVPKFGTGSLEPASRRWIRDPDRRQYVQVVFGPSGNAPAASLNLWAG